MMKLLLYSLSICILACVGSFIGVCADRIPRNEQIIKGKSHCTGCGKELKFYELIPVFSYLFLRGKCKSCKTKIPIFCLLIELLTIAAGIMPLLIFGFTFQALAYSLAFCFLLEIAVLDCKTMEISNLAVLFIGLIGLIAMFVNGTYLSSLIGAYVISIPFLVLASFGLMGMGDVKLMAAVGILLGWKLTLLSAFLGIVIGSVFALVFKLCKQKKWKSEMAFGPYLCIGTYVAMLSGEKIIELYMSLF